MAIQKVNLSDKLDLITAYWKPGIVGQLNGQVVKMAKLKGEFVWHSHEHEDELFLVLDGELVIELKDEAIHLKKGEFVIIPKGVSHKPVAREEVSLLLFEPLSTLNTGDIVDEFTVHDPEWI